MHHTDLSAGHTPQPISAPGSAAAFEALPVSAMAGAGGPVQTKFISMTFGALQPRAKTLKTLKTQNPTTLNPHPQALNTNPGPAPYSLNHKPTFRNIKPPIRPMASKIVRG